jgi:hypothetical protein
MEPSDRRDKFVRDLEFLFIDTLEEAKVLKSKTKMSMRDCMIYVATRRLLIKMTDNFNKPYFESQIANLDPCGEYNKDTVIKYIRSFDKEQLRQYFALVGIQNFNGGHFISDESFINLWNELDDECSKVSECFGGMKGAIIENPDRDADEKPIIKFNKPYINEVTGEVYESVNPLYFFEHLPAETIIRVFEKHIDGNMEMLAFVTAAFASADFETAQGITFAMCVYQIHYSIYALDLTKYSSASYDFSNDYLDFLIDMSESDRANREKF